MRLTRWAGVPQRSSWSPPSPSDSAPLALRPRRSDRGGDRHLSRGRLAVELRWDEDAEDATREGTCPEAALSWFKHDGSPSGPLDGLCERFLGTCERVGGSDVDVELVLRERGGAQT